MDILKFNIFMRIFLLYKNKKKINNKIQKYHKFWKDVTARIEKIKIRIKN